MEQTKGRVREGSQKAEERGAQGTGLLLSWAPTTSISWEEEEKPLGPSWMGDRTVPGDRGALLQ